MSAQNMPAQRVILSCAYRLFTKVFGPEHLVMELGFYWDLDEKTKKYVSQEKSENYKKQIIKIFTRLHELENKSCSDEEVEEGIKLLQQIQEINLDLMCDIRTAEYRIETSRKLISKRTTPIKKRRESLLEIWLSGKYSSRDICADEEWEGLGFPSFRAARESLNGSPDPTKS